MVLYNDKLIFDVVNLFDIVDCEGKFFVVKSVLMQCCKILGESGVKVVYQYMMVYWFRQVYLFQWNGLMLLGVDGVVWCIEDMLENVDVFLC